MISLLLIVLLCGMLAVPALAAPEGSSDNPMELFKLKDVQMLLSSAEFFPAQEAEATN